MDAIPLPSHVHYELLLQLLERQTTFAVGDAPRQKDKVHDLIVTLRKAMSQQKQLETDLERLGYPVEYRWSLNTAAPPRLSPPVVI
jgi:Zn-finger domain-containing protein